MRAATSASHSGGSTGGSDNMIFFALGLGRRRIWPVLALAVLLRLPAMLLLPYAGAHLALLLR